MQSPHTSLLESDSSCSWVENSSYSIMQSVLSFFKELYFKKLEPIESSELFFKSPIYLMAFLLSKNPSEIKQWIKETVNKVQDWRSEHKLLGFLQNQTKLLEAFLEDMENSIYTGLLSVLLCFMTGKKGKIYQFHDRKSLVSCDLSLEGLSVVRMAIIVFNNGFQFCALKKFSRLVFHFIDKLTLDFC